MSKNGKPPGKRPGEHYVCGRMTLKRTHCLKTVPAPGIPCAQHREDKQEGRPKAAIPLHAFTNTAYTVDVPRDYQSCFDLLSKAGTNDARIWIEATADELYRRLAVADHPRSQEHHLRYLSDDIAAVVRSAVASRADCPLDLLEMLAKDSECANSILRRQNNPTIIIQVLNQNRTAGATILAGNRNMPGRMVYSIIRTALQQEREETPLDQWDSNKKQLWAAALSLMAAREDCPEMGRYFMQEFLEREFSTVLSA